MILSFLTTKIILMRSIANIELSGFLKHYLNDVEGIHDFGDICKYGHVCQAKGGSGEIPGTIPPLKQTNKQAFSKKGGDTI